MAGGLIPVNTALALRSGDGRWAPRMLDTHLHSLPLYAFVDVAHLFSTDSVLPSCEGRWETRRRAQLVGCRHSSKNRFGRVFAPHTLRGVVGVEELREPTTAVTVAACVPRAGPQSVLRGSSPCVVRMWSAPPPPMVLFRSFLSRCTQRKANNGYTSKYVEK